MKLSSQWGPADMCAEPAQRHLRPFGLVVQARPAGFSVYPSAYYNAPTSLLRSCICLRLLPPRILLVAQYW